MATKLEKKRQQIFMKFVRVGTKPQNKKKN